METVMGMLLMEEVNNSWCSFHSVYFFLSFWYVKSAEPKRQSLKYYHEEQSMKNKNVLET